MAESARDSNLESDKVFGETKHYRSQIPQQDGVRNATDIPPEDELNAAIEDSLIPAEKRERILKRLKARFASIPSEVSLSDELISERRSLGR